jgi:hypothetical protein
MLPVPLDCTFLIVSSVFSNLYLVKPRGYMLASPLTNIKCPDVREKKYIEVKILYNNFSLLVLIGCHGNYYRLTSVDRYQIN